MSVLFSSSAKFVIVRSFIFANSSLAMRLIYITVAWVLGISLARALPDIETIYWIGALVSCALPLAITRSKQRPGKALLLLLILAAGGARQSILPRASDIAAYNGLSGTITGVVIDEPRYREDRVQLRLQAETVFVNSETVSTSGLALVEAPRGAEIDYGDRVKATGALAAAATGDTFSYADYLGRRGVFTIIRNAGLEVISRGHGDRVFGQLLELKGIVRNEITRALPEPQAGLLTGILLGDESGISPQLKADFSRVGASHVIAISGYNMVIVSAIVMRVLSSLFGGKSNAASIIAVAAILVYSLFVGASPAILRAALMSILLVIGSQLKRRTFVPASLAFATLLLSIGDPNVLLDIGFQLSFFAVLGLGLFAEPLSQRFAALLDRLLPGKLSSLLQSFLNEPLIVSVAAQVATLPLIILYFGRLSLVALPVNMLIVPVQSAVLLLGLAAAFTSVFAPALGLLFFWADALFLSWTISVVRAFAGLEFADVAISIDGRIIQSCYILLIGGAMVQAARPPLWRRIERFLRRNTVVMSALAASCTLLALMLALAGSRSDGKLHVWLLDVGHSNAVLMQTPGGAQILVDGGRYPARLLTAIGDRLPFYDRKLEILVITHPDEWDIAALETVLDRYAIGTALYHGQENNNESFNRIMDRLQQSDTPLVEARAGYRLAFEDGVKIEVLHPQRKPRISDKLNDHVLVLRLSYGGLSFLLTSDLSAAGQEEMLAAGISPVSAVMQIPQHGAVRALDDEFLKRAQPQVALLQSDSANRRGDPAPDTVAPFDESHLFRTDELGTIHLVTDSKTLYVAGDEWERLAQPVSSHDSAETGN